jgi:hypothetical protein
MSRCCAATRERLADCRKRVNRLPLGAAALAGTSYPIDREFVARELGFDGVCENSLDASATATSPSNSAPPRAGHDPCLAPSEELILWMSPRFGFIDLADRFCTGSSIMPQKKNPDVPNWRAARPAACRPPDGPAHADEGPAAGLQQGQPGRQGAAVRHRGHADRHAAHLRRDGARHRRQARGMAAPCARATPPPPTWPTTWSRRACPSATRTKPSRAPSA